MKTHAWAVAARLLLLLGLSFAPFRIGAAEPSYLSEFPAPERIASEVRGRDERDTKAKRVGAYRQLSRMVMNLAGVRALTADEQAQMRRYGEAASAIDQPMLESFDAEETQRLGMRSPRAKWVALCSMYELDHDLREELLNRFFSPTFQAEHGAAIRSGGKVFKHTQGDFLQEDSPPWLQWVEDLPWYTFPAYVLAFCAAVSIFLVLRYFQLEFRGHGLDPRNPRVLLAGKRRYKLIDATGIVAGQEKTEFVQTETRVYSDQTSPTGQSSTSFSRRTKSHKFYIKKPDGTEELAWLDHHWVEARDGNRLSAVRVMKPKEEFGKQVIFVNHDLGKTFFDDKALGKLMRPRLGLIWRLTVAALFVGLYVRAYMDYPQNRANYPTVFDYSGAMMRDADSIWGEWIAEYQGLWLSCVIVFLILVFIVRAIRRRRFKRIGCLPLLEELEAEAARIKAIGFDGSPVSRSDA